MKGSQSLFPSKHKPPGETGRGQLLWVEGAEGAPRRPCGPAGPPGRASHAARVAAGAPVLRSRDLGLGAWAAVPELVGVTWDGCSGGPRPPCCPGLTVQSHGAAARPRGPTAHWTTPPPNPWASLGRWLNSPLRAVCLSGPPPGGNHAVCSAAVSLRPFNTEQLPWPPWPFTTWASPEHRVDAWRTALNRGRVPGRVPRPLCTQPDLPHFPSSYHPLGALGLIEIQPQVSHQGKERETRTGWLGGRRARWRWHRTEPPRKGSAASFLPLCGDRSQLPPPPPNPVRPRRPGRSGRRPGSTYPRTRAPPAWPPPLLKPALSVNGRGSVGSSCLWTRDLGSL